MSRVMVFAGGDRPVLACCWVSYLSSFWDMLGIKRVKMDLEMLLCLWRMF